MKEETGRRQDMMLRGKEEDAGLTLEEAKQQAQVLIRYVAINQSEVIFFSVIIHV